MKTCSFTAYVCPSQVMPGLVFVIADIDLKPDDVAKITSTGYFKASIVAIEVSDESAT